MFCSSRVGPIGEWPSWSKALRSERRDRGFESLLPCQIIKYLGQDPQKPRGTLKCVLSARSRFLPGHCPPYAGGESAGRTSACLPDLCNRPLCTPDGCATLLQMAGHEVRTAYSGREALAIAAEFLPQIALLDIGMPEMNGYEVARQIRVAPWGRNILLVAVTGWGQEEDRREAEAAGFDHHRAKPVDLDSLEPVFTKCALEAAANQPS
jgi:CheY-like chemotaxis protein